MDRIALVLCLLIVHSNTQTIKTVSGCTFCDGNRNFAQFYDPYGITLDSTNGLLVITDDNSIRTIDTLGINF